MSDIHDELEKVTGNADGSPIPQNIIPIPAGSISYTMAAEIIFKAFAEKQTLFIREGVVHEIHRGSNDILQPVEPERFCSIIERLEKRIARREMDKEGNLKWRSNRFPAGAAKVILSTDEARTILPTIRQLANCPIITPEGKILTRGYHDFQGGTFISAGGEIPDIPLDRAVRVLVNLLRDFDFTTSADKSRAVASFISPALKMGGHISDDFPMDFAEADDSQSGKTYRQKIAGRLYNETPSAITQPKGGVGGLDESVARALIEGRPFIAMDNIRGKIDSTLLESAIRGHGKVVCRIPYKAPVAVDTTSFLWQFSTNGADLTTDLANRSIITRIRKKPMGFKYHEYIEGDLLAHVKSQQPIYMGAIFAVIRAWIEAGSPKTSEGRHDFRGWCQVLDWIIQNVFEMPPLLDGHREEQARTSSPDLQWLRSILIKTHPRDYGVELNVGGLLQVMEDNGVDLPGNPFSKDEPAQRVGKVLARIFREAESEKITIDGHLFERTQRQDSTVYGDARFHKFYTISKP